MEKGQCNTVATWEGPNAGVRSRKTPPGTAVTPLPLQGSASSKNNCSTNSNATQGPPVPHRLIISIYNNSFSYINYARIASFK